ncbi:hypothetical protein DERP_011094 [Dermatophagoides pteronyssinus]|uniref:Uncharacterized protein n=1 Tax=Dermatophagoides pteronyssinus TaxID=6956 RepID=A0ABQ8J8W7_DERPT|nr:hypothetical protein DERP_011094 [Dermatophagoides pteronyssinus]
MLPIITFEPIQINLLRNQDLDQSSRSSSTMADNLLDRSSSTTTKMKTKPKTLTLYPITVEFNRLIRRRQQQQQQQNRIDSKTISSSTAINNSSNDILNDFPLN